LHAVTAPLAGIRVLDLTRVLAGPLCTMMLGDLGADVLKVERPGGGDETRGWGPPFAPDGASAYYLSVNRNKRSVVLDLDAAQDRELMRNLAAGADAVVDNFRPGMLERRGLDPIAILADNARLVWCTLTGFGQANQRPGYDFVVQAEAGWMAITGHPDGEPMKVGVALADVIAGKDAAVTVLAALLGRGTPRPPEERWLRVALAHSATAALVNVAQNALVSGEEPGRWGNAHPNLVPYQLFATADRPIVLAVGSDPQWLACCRALGRDDLAQDLELRTNAGRVGARETVVREITQTLAARPAAEWLGRLEREGVPAGVVRGVREALADVAADAWSGISPLPPGRVRLPPPRLDEHGTEVRRMGWRAFPG
jgi:crotonobetainyl-CoA:carnitine CoA-transferase CaiB-like acyl-CoA transferase